MTRIFIFFALFLCIVSQKSNAQQVTIKLGQNEIAANQMFTITMTIHNSRLKSYGNFPEIEGFIKRGLSNSSSSQYYNGRMTSSKSVTQSYAPKAQGVYKLPPFYMKVNGADVKSPGTSIKVGPPKQQRRSSYDPFARDPFEEFFGQNGRRQAQEFIEVDADAFLALTTNKNEIYTGEGLHITLSFFVAKSNKAPMQFFELGKQLEKIIKQIKPNNSWEENFNIEQIQAEPTVINGKNYDQYKLYEATFFPLNDEDIFIPKVGMKFLKYDVAKNPSFFGNNRKESFTDFTTKAKKIIVKPLPPHPLKESVFVGDYKLYEKTNIDQLQTGESFNYQFKLKGVGNISAIKDIEVDGGEMLDLYPPNIQQDIIRGNSTVRGEKNYHYYAVPNEPGELDLGDYFQWIYFNPRKAKYDTLSSKIVLSVSGESKKNESISSSDLGSFYDRIMDEDNGFFPLDEMEQRRNISNIVSMTLFALMLVLMVVKIK